MVFLQTLLIFVGCVVALEINEGGSWKNISIRKTCTEHVIRTEDMYRTGMVPDLLINADNERVTKVVFMSIVISLSCF